MERQEDWLWWRKKIDDVTYAKDRASQNALMDGLAAHAAKRCDELAAHRRFVEEVEGANDEHRGTNSYLAEKIDAALTRLKKEVG